MRNINLYCLRACHHNQYNLLKKITNYKYLKEIDAFYTTDIIHKKNLSSLSSKEINYYDKKLCDNEFYKFLKLKNNSNVFLISNEKLLQQILRRNYIEENYIYKCEIIFTDLCDN